LFTRISSVRSSLRQVSKQAFLHCQTYRNIVADFACKCVVAVHGRQGHRARVARRQRRKEIHRKRKVVAVKRVDCVECRHFRLDKPERRLLTLTQKAVLLAVDGQNPRKRFRLAVPESHIRFRRIVGRHPEGEIRVLDHQRITRQSFIFQNHNKNFLLVITFFVVYWFCSYLPHCSSLPAPRHIPTLRQLSQRRFVWSIVSRLTARQRFVYSTLFSPKVNPSSAKFHTLALNADKSLAFSAA